MVLARRPLAGDVACALPLNVSFARFEGVLLRTPLLTADVRTGDSSPIADLLMVTAAVSAGHGSSRKLSSGWGSAARQASIGLSVGITRARRRASAEIFTFHLPISKRWLSCSLSYAGDGCHWLLMRHNGVARSQEASMWCFAADGQTGQQDQPRSPMRGWNRHLCDPPTTLSRGHHSTSTGAAYVR